MTARECPIRAGSTCRMYFNALTPTPHLDFKAAPPWSLDSKSGEQLSKWIPCYEPYQSYIASHITVNYFLSQQGSACITAAILVLLRLGDSSICPSATPRNTAHAAIFTVAKYSETKVLLEDAGKDRVDIKVKLTKNNRMVALCG